VISTVKLENLGQWPQQITRECHGAIVEAMRVSVKTHAIGIIQTIISGDQPRPPVNTGEYRRNWKVRNITDGVMLFNPTVQAGIIERGRRPGFGVSREGQEALARWVHLHGMDRQPVSKRERATRRKLRAGGITKEGLRARSRWRKDSVARGIAFLIARAIKRRGLPAHNILKQAKRFITMQVTQDVQAAIAKRTAG